MKVIKPCNSSYQNLGYLVKKITPKKYWLVNITVKLNQAIVRDINLPLFTNDFSKKFATCTISSLIKFFSNYDQVEINEKSWDLTAFIILLSLIPIISLFQDITNSII